MRQNDSLRSEQIDVGWTSGSSWAQAKSHAREMHVVVVRRDAPHALDPLAFPGARSHSRKIGFRKADAPDRQQRVGSRLREAVRLDRFISCHSAEPTERRLPPIGTVSMPAAPH